MAYPEQAGDDPLKQAQKEAALAKAKAERIEAEKQMAEGERAIRQARRDLALEETVAAQVGKLKSLTSLTETPATPVTLPSGGLTVGEGVVFPQILDSVNQQLRSLIQQWLGDQVNLQSSQLIIYQEQDAWAVHHYRLLLDQIQSLHKASEQVFQRTQQIIRRANAWLENQPLAESQNVGIGLIAVPALASGIVKSVADLVQLFKKEVDIRSQSSLLTEEDAVALLQKEALRAGLKLEIYYPKLYPVYKTGVTSPFVEQWHSLAQSLQLAAEAAEAVPGLLERLHTWADTDERKFRLQQLTQEWNDLQAALTVIQTTHVQLKQEGTRENAFMIQPLEQLSQLLMNNSAYHLRLQVSSKGAYQITKRLWWNAEIEYHASVELNYMLFQSDGQLIRADKLSSRASFT
ncbi:hypothetical protein [Siphonobacter sp. SORGH_AS_1065]|uniref:hypothetical protein n=1 Tax=Siphonobacter sp. SORGH_AS_1065 TaxID=3041795 RepID=UPI0027854D67|nr:hypothetical protein [Siphonobacter sp. SORGH_AS_1065]MDQ1086365.1 ElaB/YqjD/DUF883 family membrane-anchored ribosome-binding protein [Siphonobacter sp. SORGH_AS_1065]